MIGNIKLSDIEKCLSKERLNVCFDFLRLSSLEEAIFCYHHLQSLSSLCFIPLHYVEVVLRNKVYDALLSFYCGRRKSIDLPGSPEEWYLWMPQRDKTKRVIQESIHRLRVGKSSPMTCDIIAQLPFGLWVSVLEEFPDEKAPLYFWRGITHAVFSNIKGKKNRRNILFELRNINNVRNRLFHHEPIWKTDKVSSFDTALEEIRRKHDKILTVLSWLSSDMVYLLDKLGHGKNFQLVCERILWEKQDYGV